MSGEGQPRADTAIPDGSQTVSSDSEIESSIPYDRRRRTVSELLESADRHRKRYKIPEVKARRRKQYNERQRALYQFKGEESAGRRRALHTARYLEKCVHDESMKLQYRTRSIKIAFSNMMVMSVAMHAAHAPVSLKRDTALLALREQSKLADTLASVPDPKTDGAVAAAGFQSMLTDTLASLQAPKTDGAIAVASFRARLAERETPAQRRFRLDRDADRKAAARRARAAVEDTDTRAARLAHEATQARDRFIVKQSIAWATDKPPVDAAEAAALVLQQRDRAQQLIAVATKVAAKVDRLSLEAERFADMPSVTVAEVSTACAELGIAKPFGIGRGPRRRPIDIRDLSSRVIEGRTGKRKRGPQTAEEVCAAFFKTASKPARAPTDAAGSEDGDNTGSAADFSAGASDAERSEEEVGDDDH